MRTAWGEYFGLKREEATMERMAGALHRLGFDYVYDTNFAADLTIMEEGNEFLAEKRRIGTLAHVHKLLSRLGAFPERAVS